MRDIIFRGMTWNCKWVEGYYACAIDKNNLKQHNILKTDCVFGYFDWTVVLPDTIGQYTGLCDKNGKRIFEGDIVENSDDLYIVEWTEDNARFSLCDKASYVDADFDNFWGHELEVIGNIHENKELLEAVK